MPGNEPPTAEDYVSPVTTSSSGTSAPNAPKRSKRSPDKQEQAAQRKAAAARAQRGRRAIVNALELLLPAIDDLPTADALKACCEILRRVSTKAASLSIDNINERTQQLELFQTQRETA